MTINSLEDLSKLQAADKELLASGKKIIVVGNHIIKDRAYDVLGALASWTTNLIVLYPGVVATQHAMRVLTDKGHRTFLVGNQKFREGDIVKISAVGTKARVTNLSATSTQEIISLWDASLFGTELCGGKAERLSRLKIAGFQVPHGAIITTKIFDEAVKCTGGNMPVSLEQFEKLYAAFANPLPELQNKIRILLGDYVSSGKSYAVRSSGTIEDTAKASMAGMFESVINVSGENIIAAVIKVIRSTFAPHIATYLKDKTELIPHLKMAVAVQELVDAKTAGVIFCAQLETRNRDIVEIEATKGLGEGVVAGTTTEIERYRFSRSEKQVIEKIGPEILSQSQARALFLLSERIRSEFHDIPQDIEWAIDKNGQIWVLQSRDLIL